MKTPASTTLAALAAALVAALALAAGESSAQIPAAKPRAAPPEGPALPVGPVSPLTLLHAQPFRVLQPFAHVWRADEPLVDAGWLLVLELPPDLALPRQDLEPVLYVGNQTAERVNAGYPDGRLVLVVPAPAGASGAPALDLRAAPIWFGSPASPERLDAGAFRSELQSALAAGIAPRPGAEIDSALERGGPALTFADQAALRRHAAGLVLLHAPSERDVAAGILAPPPERALIR